MWAFLLFFLGFLSIVGQCSACDLKVDPAAMADPKYELRGDRCEGLYGHPVGTQAGSVDGPLVIAGFVYGAVEIPPNDVKLSWRVTGNSAVKLIGLSLRPRYPYRMDIQLPQGASKYTWQSDVRRRTTLRPHEISVSARISRVVNGETQTFFVPVQIEPSTLAELSLVIIPRSDVKSLFMRLDRLRPNGGRDPVRVRDRVEGLYSAGRGATVPLRTLSAGSYVATFEVNDDGGGEFQQEVWLQIE
jgi:hypothetical protein